MLPILLLTCATLVGQDKLPAGTSRIDVAVAGKQLEIFTYKPAAYKDGPLLFVFHGVLRNADEYRDHSCKMADRFEALVVAPRFDAKQFPTNKYQLGGLLLKEKLAPKEEWTWSLVPRLAAEMRKREGRPDLAYYLIGHSGGGQFLVRLAGFVPTEARRIVAANPGTHLFPNRELPYPYGFGKLPDEVGDDGALRRYLAQPLTLYLGTEDTKQDQNFPKGELASKQGNSRLERGRNAFQEAERLAKSNGWPFHWRLVEADGIGHDHEGMFNHAACEKALFGAK